MQSEEIGYKVTLLILSIWIFYNCWQAFADGIKYSPLPGLTVCLAVCPKFFTNGNETKMIAGGEEYHKPNKIVWTIVGSIVVAAILLSVTGRLKLNRRVWIIP